MGFLDVLVLSIFAGAGGWLSSYPFKDQGGLKYDKKAIFVACLIATIVGIALLLGNRLFTKSDGYYVVGLFAVIVLSGVLGGVISYYYNLWRVDAQLPKPELVTFILMGVGAALLVPLFLNILTSNLLAEIKDDKWEKGLVLVGFCLAAAISSEPFIKRILTHVQDMGEGVAASVAKVDDAIKKLQEARTAALKATNAELPELKTDPPNRVAGGV